MEIEYYEDIELHQKIVVGEYTANRDEMIEFAKKWGPQPYHIDEIEKPVTPDLRFWKAESNK